MHASPEDKDKMDVGVCCVLCVEMGATQAASKLIMMDADTRNSIIENMAPRAAANTLTSMEDAMQALASEPGSPEVRHLSQQSLLCCVSCCPFGCIP